MGTAAVPAARGRLMLVPAPLDFGCGSVSSLADSMPEGTLRRAASISHWICESAKSTRAYLKRIDALHALATPVQQQTLAELPREVHKQGDHLSAFDARPLLGAALHGHDIGLVSEAGMPAVADPGSSVVRAAHGLGLDVVALVGPVSLLLALAASGLNGQNFAFVGYLPQDAAERTQRIRALESLALKTRQTQLFIETPYRNAALAGALLASLQPNTRLAIGSGLTLARAAHRSRLVRDWKRLPGGAASELPDNTTPAVFGIGR